MRHPQKPKHAPQGPRGTIHHKLNEAVASQSLPFSDDAEKGVLSSFLHNPDLLNNTHKDEWFYHPANLMLFQSMMALKALGAPVEYIALSQFMTDNGTLDRIGGQGYLAELLDFVPTPMHYGYYIDILIGRHLGRASVSAGVALVEAGYGHDHLEIEGLANQHLVLIEAAARGIRKEVTMDVELEKWQTEWELMATGKKSSAMPTRWKTWNKRAAGISPGYTIIMGSRGSGKSVLAQNIISDAAIAFNRPALFVSYEMPVRMILNRLISDLGNIHGAYLFRPDIAQPTKEIEREINKCVERIRASRLKIIHDVTMDVNGIASRARHMKIKMGDCVLAVDYLQLLGCPKGVKCDLREQVIAANSAVLRDLSKELDIPVLALSQTNAQGSARESNAPEQDADEIFRIERYRLPDGTTKDDGILCTKSRNGEDGPIAMKLEGAMFRFLDSEKLMP